MDRDEVEVHKLSKKERGQYLAIFTEQTWSIKDLLYGCLGSQSQRAILFILPARGARNIITYLKVTFKSEEGRVGEV